MEDRLFKIRISPENIKGDLVPVRYILNEYSEEKNAILYRKLEKFIDSSDYQYHEQKIEFN